MRENRTSGSEGREAENSIRLPYPYRRAWPSPEFLDEPKKLESPVQTGPRPPSAGYWQVEGTDWVFRFFFDILPG